jgi:transposase
MRPADQYSAQDLIRVQSDPAILYASLELSQSSWLVTSLSPGSEKMSKYATSAGDGAELKAIGPQIASVLYNEGLYRSFANRRDVAAYAGLAPTPWRSGSIDREQGISKAGNPRLRHIMIELAWLWVRHQPDSALTAWFRAR